MPGYIHSYGGPNCYYIDQTFNPQTATVDDKLTYAKCINDLYQIKSDIIWIKIGIIVTILTFIIGMFMGLKRYFYPRYSHNRDVSDLVAYPFFGATFGALIIFVPYAIYSGIWYILQ